MESNWEKEMKFDKNESDAFLAVINEGTWLERVVEVIPIVERVID